jgi:outer membrane receptor protein involved in Fe transport
MLQRLTSLFVLFFLIGSWAYAQDGKIAGTVTGESGEPLPFATVVVYSGELFVNGARTDENGKYSIQPVEGGTYSVVAKYLTGEKRIENVPVRPGQTRFLDISFKDEELESKVDEVVIEGFKIPVFEKDAPSGQTIGGEEVNNIGTRNTFSLAAITPGVFQSDEGSSSIRIRGARANATVYYIDGQKVRGSANLPQAAIASLQVITGGTPAEFGDFTGGVVSITTAKPAPRFSGGGEIVTSEYLDAFGRNLAALSFTGPLITKKRQFGEETVKVPILGYFVAAEAEYNQDRSPQFPTFGLSQLKPDVLADLRETPMQLAPAGNTFISRANFVTRDDFEQIQAKANSERRLKVLARLDFQPIDNVLLKLGGNVELSNQDLFSYNNIMFSPQGNGNFRSNLYRGWARFQQSFKGDDNSLLRNLFYQIQADYSLYQRLQQHPDFQNNLFDYGYIGEFTFDRVPFYTYVDDPLSSVSSSPYWQTAGYGFTNLQFDGSNSRLPILANYNEQIMNHVETNGIPNPFPNLLAPEPVINNLQSLQNLRFVQGILNGGGAGSIYGIFGGLGNEYSTFQQFDFSQFRLNGQATAEIKGHNIKAGFEFEQRTERRFGINARALWGFMRQYTNFHFANSLEDDPSTFQYVYSDDGVFQDTVMIPNLYNGDEQKTFDINLRQKLGLPVDGTDFINIDAYSPDTYSLDMFSADELLNNGNGIITYYGYDYTGNPMDERVDAGAFFTDLQNRPMNAYAPTYISGFIQDKFEFEDILFNLGLRVDRFDANQPVLRDPFSLHPTFSAGETANLLGVNLPSGVGNDWVAYVDDALSPSSIIGYRSGELWFDADGAPTSSNTIATASGGRPKPHTRDDEVSIESFEDYEPQTVFMPRISFSFPISDVALFFAHYDVLSQRPGQDLVFLPSSLAGQISQYAFLENNPTVGVSNPALRPEITVDYEVGFRQKIGDRMALSVQAFYREFSNMIRFRRFQNAYPFTYDTNDNLDYATVKGLTLSYDMRRTGNLQLRASYTLQYANTTGVTGNAARNLNNQLEGASVLRVPFPSGIDQRHRIVGVVDYRYGGPNMGPSIKLGKKEIHPLKNAGANLTLTMGSGTPYSQSLFSVPTAVGGTPIVQNLQGTLNGKRLPFTFRADLRLDKAFSFGGKKKEDGTKSRTYMVNFYLLTLNLFNTRNVLGVYRYTGLPDDDGYLASDIGQQDISFQISPESYVDLYTVAMMNPGSFSRPRTIRLGMNFNF